MTSVTRETGRAGGLPCFRRRLAHRFAESTGRRQRVVSEHRVREAARALEPVAA